MLLAHRRFRRSLYYAIAAVLITISLGIEWLSYSILPWTSWPSFPLVSEDAIKILLVADPQLLGEQTSMRGILGSFERWDADRFIQRTFMYSYHHIKPHIVIFLGDVFDEGEIANEEEFARYMKRFLKVFGKLDFHLAIFVPGDNDIGGEDQFPLPEYMNRFNFYFRNDSFLQKQFLDIIKVNVLIHSSEIGYVPPVVPGRIRVAISHFPLTSLYVSYIGKVIPTVNPHLIFSAHEHTSAHILSDRETKIHLQLDRWIDEDKIQEINLTEENIHEIMVPTCSYRMGTQRIGYGAAIIEPSGSMLYTVLWLPSRLVQLKLYLAFLCLIILILLVVLCKTSIIKLIDISKSTADKELTKMLPPFRHYVMF